jgi:hypothetical protein
MKDSVPRQDTAASDPTVAAGTSRRGRRLIQPRTPSLYRDEQAHKTRAQSINDDDPPLTILAW